MSNWIERHSVNCYFCHTLIDERDGYPADEFNGNDGGTACPQCLKARQDAFDAQEELAMLQAEGQELPEDFNLKPTQPQ